MKLRLILALAFCFAVSSTSPALARKDINFSSCKPQSTGDITINGRQILAKDATGQYQPFYVKGIGYAPGPIGTFPFGGGVQCYPSSLTPTVTWTCTQQLYHNTAILTRDLTPGPTNNLAALNANVLRTWGGDVTQLLTHAKMSGKKVLAGYWLNHDLDYTNPTVRNTEKANFRQFVQQTDSSADADALFGYGLFNENNIDFCSCCPTSCNITAQKQAFYSLINEMAYEAYMVEGADYKPVVTVFAGLADIGDSTVGADDASLCNIDIHGSNNYLGASFTSFKHPVLAIQGNLFEAYEQLSSKPLLITEFGTDSLIMTDPNNDPGDPFDGIEDEEVQARFVRYAWEDIVKHSVYATGSHPGKVTSGGVVLSYTDNWWRPDQNWDYQKLTTHNMDYPILNGWPWGAGQPDGYINEEYLGVCAVQRDPSWTVTNQLPDIVTPKLLYNELNTIW